MITEMLKNCIPIEMILVAVRSMETALSTRVQVDITAENRRAWDREYRRKTRASPPDPPDIHPIPPDVGVIALSLEDKKEGSYPVKKERKQENKKERGCKLPPDWIPKQAHYDEGATRGMSRGAVDDLAVTMRTWAAANANRSVTTKADWDATFMGFVRKENRNGNGTHAGAHPASNQSGSTSILAGVAAATERRARERHAARQQRQAPADDDDPERTDPELFGAPRSATPHH
jgi:hypothetical protein